MNSIHPSTQFCGATGNFPIYDFIDNTSNVLQYNSSNFTFITSNKLNDYIYNTSNNLNDYIYNVSNEISPVLFDLRDFQHSRSDKIIYKDYDNNNNVVIVETDSNAEVLFKNFNGDVKTKIDKNGDIYVYHGLEILPAGYSAGWWGVENRIAEAITLTQGLRFDVTNLQADGLLIWSAIGTAQTTADLGVTNAAAAQATANTALFNAAAAQLTANTALANAAAADGVATGALGLATTAQATATEAVGTTLVINGILPYLISSNILTNVNIFLISSNNLSDQKYINSNSITDITSFYISSNNISDQKYINSNSITDITSFYISSNNISDQKYINSNSITDITSFYISSNNLSDQKYINSNSITDILSTYISNKGGVIGGKFEFIDGKITIGLPKDATTISNEVDTYTLNPNSQLDIISDAYFAGNVGFGVTNPSYKLHFGNPFNGPTNSYQLSIDNDNAPRTGYRIANIYNGQQNAALKFINDINNAGGSACTFWTRNPVDNTYTTRLTINAAGEATFEQEVISVKSFTCGANYFFNGNLNGKVEYKNISNNPTSTKRFKIESNRFLYDAYTQCYYYDFELNRHMFDNMINVGTVAYPILARSRVFKVISMNCFDFVHLDSINNTSGNSPIGFSEEITVYQTNIDPSINITDAGASPVESQAFNNYVILGKKKDINIGYWNFWTTNYGYMRYLTKQPLDLYFTLTQIW